MAHAIDQTTGQAAVFVTGEPAWHKLGSTIETAASSAEAIGLAGLDWRVEQWPVRAFDPDNPTTEAAMPDTVANVRADTKAVLGVVGTRTARATIEDPRRASPPPRNSSYRVFPVASIWLTDQ